MPRPQYCKMFTSDTVAINIMHRMTIPYSWNRYFLNEYIHVFLILYPCVKASDNWIVPVSVVSQTLHVSLSWKGEKKTCLAVSPWITARRSSCVPATMFSLQLCDLKWQQERHQNRRSRRLLLASGPQIGFSSPFGYLSKIQPQRRERNPTAPSKRAAGPPHLPCPQQGARGSKNIKENGIKKQQKENTAWQRPKLARCRAKIQWWLWSPDFGEIWRQSRMASRRGLRAQVQRERRGPPASKHLQPPGTGPCSHITSPVPAGPARVSGRGHPPLLTLPSRALPASRSGRAPGSVRAGTRARPGAPGLPPALTFWIRFSAMGQGGRRGHRPAGDGCGARGRGGVAGAARWFLGWLRPVGPRLAAGWLAPGACARSVCARARVCASERAGTPARLFCFRFYFWEGACARPARAPPLRAPWEV